MQFFKKTISLAAALIIFSMSFLNLSQVNALDVPLPLDIHMTIDTVEIDIKDIPENRIVPVDVYLENCPEFTGLWVFFEKDPRLSIAPVIPFVVAEEVENASTINVTTNATLEPQKICCGVPSEYPSTINHSGAFLRINAILPENIQIGDFYSLNFSRTFCDTTMSIDFGLELDDRYFEESFTQLNAGGILITGEIPTEFTPPTTELTYMLGDVNADGSVDSSDASRVLVEYAKIQTGGAGEFTDIQYKAADVNKDGVVDSSDASKILAYYAMVSTGKKPTWD